MSTPDADIEAREAAFHDRLAAEMVPGEMPPREPDHLERALLDCVGGAHGLRILDLGCGTGDLSLMLMARGAVVTGIDISPGMVALAEARADRFHAGCAAEFCAAPASATGLPSSAFDLVVGKWILHHTDVEDTAREVARLLRPGGSALFIENSNLNPFLRLARRHLAGRLGIPRYGTRDEHPLERRDLLAMQQHFHELELAFVDFRFLTLLDRQVLRYRHGGASRALARADWFVYLRLPRLRRYSFHLIVTLRSPRASA